MSQKNSYSGLNQFRIIAALMVVAIHTAPLSSVNITLDFTATYVIARIAVPFFLMITGYFSLNKCLVDDCALRRFIIKTCKLYVLAILVYLPLNIYAGHFSQGNIIVNLMKAIFFDGTFYHLWYFPASIIGVIIVYLLSKKCSLKIIFAITITLYIMGLFGDSYYGIIREVPVVATMYNGIFKFCSYTRNGIFYTPVFLVMGALLAKRKKRWDITLNIVGFSVSLLLLMFEGLSLYWFELQRHSSMYIFLLPCMFFLFQLLLFYKGQASKKLRSISLGIYIIHPLMIVGVRGIAKVTNTSDILVQNSLVHYIIVCLLSVLFSWSIVEMFNGWKKSQFHTGRAWCEIDIKCLQANVKTIKMLLPKRCNFMAAVKANAYGHGDVQISKALNKIGVKAFCVATVLEGVVLRQHRIEGEILILGYTHPAQFYLLKKYRLTQTVIDYNYARELNNYGKKIMVHIKIDTGMHRLGERAENLNEIVNMFRFKNLIINGIFTHLCVADSHGTLDEDFTKFQISSFYKVIHEIKERGIACPKVHIQSSYGVINYPNLQCDYARIGIALYGVYSTNSDVEKYHIPLKPVLSVKARIEMTKSLACGESIGYGLQFTAIQDMKIAIVSIGYADGIPRHLPYGVGSVLIHGKRACIIGRICMDQMLVDITDIPNVRSNDVAVIIGKSGNEEITAMEVAEQANTITNEILSRLGGRLEQIYL